MTIIENRIGTNENEGRSKTPSTLVQATAMAEEAVRLKPRTNIKFNANLLTTQAKEARFSGNNN